MAISVNSKHPLYEDANEDWTTVRDVYKGERQVKSKGVRYLPATTGMILDGMENVESKGFLAYRAYLKRAVFHDYFREGVERLVGIMHQKDAVITVPPKMESMIDSCTLAGEGLQLLLRRINEEQLVTGRVGIMADLPAGETSADVLPYLTTYTAEAIINWDDATYSPGTYSLNLVVLDESSYKRNGLDWELKQRYRVLSLGDLEDNESVGEAVYSWGVFESNFVSSEMQQSSYRGNVLKEIPFVFANTKDILSRPDTPPGLGLVNLVLAIYRGEADYRQNLFMQGQDTLVVIGALREPEADMRIGAGARIDIDVGGDAKFIGVQSQGLPEQRMCLEADRKRATTKSAQLVSTEKGTEESGIALNTRVAAQTATLHSIAKSGAAALENILKIVARWIGEDDSVVSVVPNLEFTGFDLFGDDMLKLTQARGLGAPISLESMHRLAVDRGITKMSFEDEMAKIEQENGQYGLNFGSINDAANDTKNSGSGTGNAGGGA